MSLTCRSPFRSASTMLRRVGSARAWKGSSCVSMYIHYHAYNGASRSPRFFRDHRCRLRDTSRQSFQQVNLPSSSHLQCPASQPRTPAIKSSHCVLSPRRWNVPFPLQRRGILEFQFSWTSQREEDFSISHNLIEGAGRYDVRLGELATERGRPRATFSKAEPTDRYLRFRRP